MKEIKINKLSLRNFKGCAALELDLEGKNASIYGDNAVGKTTVYDALTWLLFGKDSRGSADQELIKPLDKDGKVKDHEAVTCVEAELVVTETGGTDSSASLGMTGSLDSSTARAAEVRGPYGAQVVTLRKEMQEAWVTRRGSSQPVYDGNEFRYFLDGVPLKKNEYVRRVGELVEEDVFRTLTSVTAFAQDMPWRKRREILYDMSGVSDLSDRALMQQMGKEAGWADSSASRAAEVRGTYGGRNEGGVDGATLEELAEMLSGKSLEDLRKTLAAQRKAMMGTRSQIPARLDELNRQATPLEAQDYSAAEQAKATAEAELERIRNEVARIRAEASDPGDAASLPASSLAHELRELEAENARRMAEYASRDAEIRRRMQALEQDRLTWVDGNLREASEVRKALDQLETNNRAFRWQQEATLPNLPKLEQGVQQMQAEVDRLAMSVSALEQDAKDRETMVEQDRKEWISVNAESFGGAKCPTCGQDLPMEQMQRARDSFEANKARRLDDIQRRAAAHKAQGETYRANAQDARTRLDAATEALGEAKARLLEAEKTPRDILDLDGYRLEKEALTAKLAALEGQNAMPGYEEKRKALETELSAVPTEWTAYDARRATIEEKLRRENDEKARRAQEAAERASALAERQGAEKAKLEAAEAILRGRLTLRDLHKRINELREEQRRTGEELERVDRLAFGLEEFVRWKTRYIEDSVNCLFRIVTFRLFRELISGGLEECCDVVVGGVPYNALNNGARINAGADIIRRLAEHYGVRVPLFVDNAESVTTLADAGTQVIRLVVSEQDKALRVETV